MSLNSVDKLVATIAIGLTLIQGACATSHPPSSGNTFITSRPQGFEEFMANLLSFMPVHYGGLGGTYEGELIPLPDELRKELASNFPGFIFQIALIRYVAMEVPEAKLLVILDSKSKKVDSYSWVHWLVGDSPGLNSLLHSKSITSLKEAKSIALIIAKLEAFLADDEIGSLDARFVDPDLTRQASHERRLVVEIELKSKHPPNTLMVIEFDADSGYYPWEVQFR